MSKVGRGRLWRRGRGSGRIRFSMIKPPGNPQKAIFSKKWHNSAICNLKTLIFEYATQNNHRKLLAKTGWNKYSEKILIRSIFGIFPSTKMAVSRPFLGRECRFLTRFITLIWRSFLPNFMTITWTVQFFEIFGISKIGYISETITDRNEQYLAKFSLPKVPE